jgi:predicted metal-binding protein
VCITCRAATHPTDALATTPGTNALGTNALGADTPPAGLALAEATAVAAANASDISVQRIRCLGNCSRGPSAAIGCEHSWTYVFGGLEPTRDGPSLIIGARLLALAADGIMPWRGRPESLKRGLIARLPPADFRGELP